MSTIRLAYHPEGGRTLSELGPTVRLATTIDGGGAMGPKAFERHLGPPPSVRLALGGAHSQDKKMAMEDPTTKPALLVSYVYLDPFIKNRAKYHYRDWVMDSGAFSAHNSGKTISLAAYIAKCQELLESDPTLTEVFSLDVIGDYKASLKNTEAMWKAGVPAVPTFHVGEPVAVLKEMAASYPKIALGGAVGYRGKDQWAAKCFGTVWPKKIHGLGFGAEKSIMALPWHSVDATNWELGPCKFGRWQSFGNMSVRGSKQNLRSEVLFYLDLEARARTRWAKEMKKLEDTTGPTVRLANRSSGRELEGFETTARTRLTREMKKQEQADGPTVRLAASMSSRAEEGYVRAFNPSDKETK